MNDKAEGVGSLGDYVGILRRRWRLLVGIVPSALLIAAFIAFVLPASYQSSATILLEPSSIAPELIKTTVVSYADQQIQLVQRTVMTADRLVKVVEQVDPYPNLKIPVREKAAMIVDDTSLQKVDPITLKPLPESSAFSIYYENPSPQIAAEVTKQIAALFLQYNRETRTEQARATFAFLSTESRALETQIRDLEQRLSDFKQRHGDALPESRARNEMSVDRTQRDLDAAEAQIRLLEQQEDLLKLQLSQVNPTLIASGSDSFTSLSAVRAELAAAQQKYTPDHPDVKRLTRALESLIAQSRAGTDRNVRPDNPEYLRISSELEAVRRNLSAQRSTSNRARAQLLDYERRLGASPVVERDFVRLERERDIAQQQFTEIQNKLREADIAQSLESEARGERYTMIRAPYVSLQPSSPNRMGIILIGLVLGISVALGLIAVREASDPTVRGSKDVVSLTNLPLLGAVPRLINRDDLRRRKLVWGAVAAAYSIGTLVVVLTIVGSQSA